MNSVEAEHLPPKIVYVMGAGRSGSTILGVALGNCEELFYAGELDAWLRRDAEPNFDGRRREEFWRQVDEEMSVDDEMFGDLSWRYLEHSSAIFRSWRPKRRLRRPYRRIAAELYESLSRLTDGSHIVDTSHYPLRARELQALEGIDLYLVYLVRAPEDVVASFGRRDVRQPPKSLLATNFYLYLTHLLSVFVFLRHRRDRRIVLRYETFVSEPKASLESLLRLVDAPPTLPDLSALETGIPFQGNRLLESDVVAFKASSKVSRSSDRLTAVLQLPWTLLLARLRPSIASGAR